MRGKRSRGKFSRELVTKYLVICFCKTKIETELDYYHQKLNVRAASQVTKHLKTKDLENEKKNKKKI